MLINKVDNGGKHYLKLIIDRRAQPMVSYRLVAFVDLDAKKLSYYAIFLF